MICHRTHEYRTREHVVLDNGNGREGLHLKMDESKASQYVPWSALNYGSPIDGAGVMFSDELERCSDCGWEIDAQVCRHCGRQT